MELYDKRVKVVNPKTGEISYNFLPPADGMDRVRHGGESILVFISTFRFNSNRFVTTEPMAVEIPHSLKLWKCVPVFDDEK